jgi:hypothetical protein
MVTRASPELIKDSFRQEKKRQAVKRRSIPEVFIGIKNNAKSAKEKKRLEEIYG